jgi:hypothetical protein
VIALGGCSLPITGDSGTEPGVPSSVTTEDASPTDKPQPDKGPVKIGQPYVYDDGLRVTITSTQRGSIPRDSIEGNPGDPRLIITVQIANGTQHNFGTGDADVIVSYGKKGDEAEQLYTYDGFNGTILRNRSKSSKFDFYIKDRAGFSDLVIEVNPDYDHGPAIFQGAAR